MCISSPFTSSPSNCFWLQAHSQLHLMLLLWEGIQWTTYWWIGGIFLTQIWVWWHGVALSIIFKQHLVQNEKLLWNMQKGSRLGIINLWGVVGALFGEQLSSLSLRISFAILWKNWHEVGIFPPHIPSYMVETSTCPKSYSMRKIFGICLANMGSSVWQRDSAQAKTVSCAFTTAP